MSYLIAIDDGHGMETPGKRTPEFSDGTVIRENQFNSPTAKFFAKEMKRCGCKTIFTAPTDASPSLATRVRIANNSKADVFVSFHYNAFRGIWDQTKGGVSTHYYIKSEVGKRLARLVQNELIKDTPQQDRGIVPGNLYVVKYTNMPAILIEAGFMDVTREAKLMLDVNFQMEVARETAIGVCKFLGIPYVGDKDEDENSISVDKSEVNIDPEMLKLQKVINRLFNLNILEDGINGNQTKNAVRKLQQILGLTVDGIAGKNTWGAINAILAKPLLKVGSSGIPTRYVQYRVGVSIDGIFGPITKNGVISYQRKNNLSADGIVGPNTWGKLIG
jgi:N-acetylmuramoyl-L-alanine amidase